MPFNILHTSNAGASSAERVYGFESGANRLLPEQTEVSPLLCGAAFVPVSRAKATQGIGGLLVGRKERLHRKF